MRCAFGDRVRVAGVAHVMEDELDPAAPVVDRVRHVALDRGHRRALFRVRRGARRVRVERRDRLRERRRAVHAGHAASAVVAACGDDGLRAGVDPAEGIRERRGPEAVVPQVDAIAADLETRVRLLERLEVHVVQRVPRDLVARVGERVEVVPAHVIRVADHRGVHEEGRVHHVRLQDRQRRHLIGDAVVEPDRHHGLVRRGRWASTPREPRARRRRAATPP